MAKWLLLWSMAVGAGLAAPLGASGQALRPAGLAGRPDSLAARPAGLPSQLVLRLDHATRALFAGRDYGVQQTVTTPSLTYNHRSGLYAGVSGSIYSQEVPAYTLTDFSVGYGNLLGSKLLYNVSYDHYAYSQSGPAVLANAAGLLLSYDLGPLSVGSSYSFSFGGGQTGHRLLPSLSGYWAWKKLGFIDKLYILPSLSATIGTQNTSYQVFPAKATKVAETAKAKKTKKGAAPLPSQPTTEEAANFGLMSWNLALPVKVRVGHVTFGVTYNYVRPIQLPHEDDSAGFSPKSYVSFSLSYALGGR